MVNRKAIDSWRKRFREGELFKKHPIGGNCGFCSDKRKKPCPLPMTLEMREGIEEDKGSVERKKTVEKAGTKLGMTTRGTRSRSRGGSSAPSATSSGKRKRLDVEMEVETSWPPTKKKKDYVPFAQSSLGAALGTATAAASAAGVPWAALVRLMEGMEARAAESSRAAVMREERLVATLANVAAHLLEQNGLLKRIADRMRGEDDEESEEEEEDDEDDDGRGRMDVEPVEATSAEAEMEIGGSDEEVEVLKAVQKDKGKEKALEDDEEE